MSGAYTFRNDKSQLHFDAIWSYCAIERPAGRPSWRKDGKFFRGVLVHGKQVVWLSPSLAPMPRLAIRNAKRAC